MAGELEQALSNKIGEEDTNDVLIQAMARLLILLLQRIKTNSPAKIDLNEEDDLAKSLKERIMNKYPKYSSLANRLIPSPS